MIQCQVCKAENEHLATVCTSCGSFIQRRIENLDLFTCAWSILERPRKGFRTVALARHKNYIVLLSAAAGFALIFGFFWITKMGEYAGNLINFLGAGMALGPPAGILVVSFVSWIIVLAGRVLRLRARLRDAYAVVAYSAVPLILTAVLFLPIEIMSFGLFFFARSPSPYTLRPFSYVVLLGLDAAFTLWSLILLMIGAHVLFGAGWRKSIAAVFTALCLLGMIVVAVSRIVLQKM